MKQICIALLISLATMVNGQSIEPTFDFRFGIGTTKLGTGDMLTVMLENELNYFVNNFFSTSISIGYGRSNFGVFESTSFTQGNINIYISPFRNNKKNDFRVGTGISYMNTSDTFITSVTTVNGVVIEEQFGFETRSSRGMNIILENTYSITNKWVHFILSHTV